VNGEAKMKRLNMLTSILCLVTIFAMVTGCTSANNQYGAQTDEISQETTERDVIESTPYDLEITEDEESSSLQDNREDRVTNTITPIDGRPIEIFQTLDDNPASTVAELEVLFGVPAEVYDITDRGLMNMRIQFDESSHVQFNVYPEDHVRQGSIVDGRLRFVGQAQIFYDTSLTFPDDTHEFILGVVDMAREYEPDNQFRRNEVAHDLVAEFLDNEGFRVDWSFDSGFSEQRIWSDGNHIIAQREPGVFLILFNDVIHGAWTFFR